MSGINVGDRIRIKDRADWPTPPGYRLAHSEGSVTAVNEADGFITIHLETSECDIPKGTTLAFRVENVEKIEE